MKDHELRLGALELTVMELAANISPDVVLKAQKCVEAGLASAADDEERMQRILASRLLQDARERFDRAASGFPVYGAPRPR